MRLATAAALVAVLVASQASAQQATPRVAITIYNNDIALVEDVRTVQFGSGRTRVEFPNVSGRIQPETAALRADGVAIVEQNFDFDLLTPVKMMEKAVGSRVRIVRTNPATGREMVETAEVLSANQGVVLRIGDRIEVLRDDGLPVRVLFDRIPENLRAKPTLSITVDSERAGARAATLRYLTGGIGWSADYVGVFDERAGSLALQGWVTLTNETGASYANARTQLVAGSPGSGGSRPQGPRRGGAGGPASDATAFADYHSIRCQSRPRLRKTRRSRSAFSMRRTHAPRKSTRSPDPASPATASPAASASAFGSAMPKIRASAPPCRRERSASTRRTPPAARNSSAKTRSATSPRAPISSSTWAQRSTSRSKARWCVAKTRSRA
jgi:hypothetical protein